MRIAVEEGLSQVRRALEDRGWQVVPLEEAWEAAVDAVILTGQDDDLFGDEAIELDVPVIAAQGLTAEEILRRLESEPRQERS